MNSMKRTTFTDKLDEEIYAFQLMIKLAEDACGYCKDTIFELKGHEVTCRTRDIIENDKLLRSFRVSIRIKDIGNFDTCEIGSEAYLDIMNCWLDSRAMFVRDPKSKYYGKFSITDGGERYQESDNILDSYLTGGINNMPEDVYFQESLIRDDHMYAYQDIDRILSALSTESTIDGAFFHHRVPGFTGSDYNELYDAVMARCK